MTSWRHAVSGLLALVIAAGATRQSDAGLLGKLLRDAADSAGDAGKVARKAGDLDLPDGLGTVLARLPDSSRTRSLVAETTPEGHIRLSNAAGETVTAANTREITSALKWLLPEVSDLARRNVDFYLPSSSLIRHRAALDILPKDARVRIAHKSESYAVLGKPPFGSGPLHVRLRENLVLKVDGKDVFDEAVWQMRRPVNQSSLRILTLDPKAPEALPRLRSNTNGKALPPEAVNPYALVKELRYLRGQTVLLTGKIDGDLLFFTPPSGKTQSVLLPDLRAAALRYDVNLIVLNADTARQPGVRNLLWQRAEIDGLGEALEKATMGDFLGALAGRRDPLELSISASGATHVTVKAIPTPALSKRMPDRDSSILTKTESIFSDLIANVGGSVFTSGVEAALRSEARETELDYRIVPGIHSDVQYIYLISIFIGLFGLPKAISWWRKLWPLRERAKYGSTLALIINRSLRFILFVPLFLPLVAPIATPYHFVASAWTIITAPFRWIFGRRAA